MARPHSTVHRTALSVAAVVLAVPLILGAVAWACTPLPRSFGLIPKSASGAAVAKAVGEGIAPRSRVEVRWDDVKGDLIGATVADEKGQFSAIVAIPPDAPGAHAVLFLAPGLATSRITAVGRLPFDITTPGEQRLSTTSADLRPVRVAGPAPANSGRASATGVAVMVVGMVTLSAGATVAVVGRRRARADSTV